jgi:hypothetical protein
MGDMLWIAGQAFVVSVWALIYWGTIKIIDRYNVKNTFGVALCIGALYSFSFQFPLPGLVMVAAWLLLLMRVTMWHYELNLGGAAIATAATVLAPYFLMPYLMKFIGDSEARAYGMLYGVPAITLGTYVVSRLRNRNATDKPKWGDGKDEPALPEARVVEIAKPIAPPAAVAPPKYEPTPIGDKPSLLS